MNRHESTAIGVFAVGQILVGAFSLGGVPLAVTETLLVGVLLVPVLGDSQRGVFIGAFAVCFAVLLAVLGIGVTGNQPLWIVTIALAVVATLLGYAVHRYELVVFDLVEETK